MNYGDKITEIFCIVDDFCKEFSDEIARAKQVALSGAKKHCNRKGKTLFLFLQTDYLCR